MTCNAFNQKILFQFAMYDKLKLWMQSMGDGSTRRISQFNERFMSGALAGAFAQSFIYPVDVVKTRLTLSVRTENKNKPSPKAFGQCTLTGGMWDCAQKLYK